MVGYALKGTAPVVLPLTTGGVPRARPRRGCVWAPHELLTLVKWSAAQLPTAFQPPQLALGHRHYELLDRTGDYELWVIHWPQDGGLVLHDHGGSTGAFYVTAGVLEETSTSPTARSLRRRLVLPGGGQSFGPDYVHSVVNPSMALATSVHAYSPPLSSMTFYARSSSGLSVSHVESEWEGAP
jgi:Cysteine dioxygenase type I